MTILPRLIAIVIALWAVSVSSVAAENPLDCSVLNIIYEAADQPFMGQIAVLDVVQTRVEHTKYGNDVCSVVYEPSQFSWTLAPEDSLRIPTAAETRRAMNLVYMFFYRRHLLPDNPVQGATHYLEPDKVSVLPHWYYTYEYMGRIGNHEFFRRPDYGEYAEEELRITRVMEVAVNE